MLITSITSADNSLIKRIVRLGKSREYRYELGQAVVYGEHLVVEALKYGILEEVIIHDDFVLEYRELVTKLVDQKVYTLKDGLMRKINLSDTPTSIIALIKIDPNVVVNNVIYHQDCIILDAIQDPGNLGTIMRVAKATGINNVVLSKGSVDPYNIKVLRASQGLQFSLKIFSNVDLNLFIQNYAGNLIATLPDCNTDIYTLDLAEPVALVFGNEGVGINPPLLTKVKTRAKIPMPGGGESLNIAMAVTVCAFEMVRQRLSKC